MLPFEDETRPRAGAHIEHDSAVCRGPARFQGFLPAVALPFRHPLESQLPVDYWHGLLHPPRCDELVAPRWHSAAAVECALATRATDKLFQHSHRFKPSHEIDFGQLLK